MRYRIFTQLCNTKHCTKIDKKLCDSALTVLKCHPCLYPKVRSTLTYLRSGCTSKCPRDPTACTGVRNSPVTSRLATSPPSASRGPGSHCLETVMRSRGTFLSSFRGSTFTSRYICGINSAHSSKHILI